MGKRTAHKFSFALKKNGGSHLDQKESTNPVSDIGWLIDYRVKTKGKAPWVSSQLKNELLRANQSTRIKFRLESRP